MKRAYFCCCTLLLICLLASNVFAVSEAAVLFLLISPSPRANGMGNTFMALPANDAYAAFYNPGYLGIFAMENYVAVGDYPQQVQWLPELINGIFYDSKAASIGFKLNNRFALGFGYHKIYLDLGEQHVRNEQGQPIGNFNAREKARAFSAGIGANFGVRIGLGMSIKYIESNLGLMISDSTNKAATADIYAYDFGVMVQVPLFEILNYSPKLPIYRQSTLKPFLVPALGYSIANYGSEIKYRDAEHGDPLPRLARVGYSIDAGIFLVQKKLKWRLVSFKKAREAEDLLIKREPASNEIKYQWGLGDIDFFHDLIGGKSNPNIFTKEGWELNLLETFYYREGEYNDTGEKVNYQTTGYGVGIAGLLKFAATLFPGNESLQFFAEHIDLQYHQSELDIEDDHPLAGTKYKGINLVIR